MSQTSLERRLENALRGDAEALRIADGWEEIQHKIRGRPYRRATALAVAFAVLVAGAIAVPKLLRGDSEEAGMIAPKPSAPKPSARPVVSAAPETNPRSLGPLRGQGGAPQAGGVRARSGTTLAGAARTGSVAALDKRILFASGPDNQTANTDALYVMDADGSHRKLLADEGDFPALSPDGRRIAYTRFNPSCTAQGERCYEIWLMNADGSQKRRLTPGRHPDWSPDGSHIAFWRCCQGAEPTEGITASRDQVYIMRADGSGVRALPHGIGRAPDWSPDGTEIAAAVFKEDECAKISVFKVDGSGWNRDVSTDGCYSNNPDWSPDGRRIVFESTGDYDPDSGIYVAASDGSGLAERLTPVGSREEPNSAFEPGWSSDGRRIAYAWDPDGRFRDTDCVGVSPRCGAGGPGRSEIYVMNADGSGRTRIGEGRTPDFIP